MRKILAAFLVSMTLLSSLAIGVPLDTFQDFTTANPITSRRGPWAQMMARGTGTDDFYVLEVDPTTGQIPVSASVSFSNDTDYGPVGADTLRTAAQIGNATGAADFGAGASGAQTLRVTVATDDVVEVEATDLDIRDLDSATDSVSAAQSGAWTVAATQSGTWSLRLQDGSGNSIGSTGGALNVSAAQSGTWNVNNISGTISLPTGAATEATLSTLNGKVNNSFGSGAGAVRTAAMIGNATGVVDYNAGNASAQTIRTVIATDQAALPASQSGTWNITNVSGTVSLPTGASTEATLSTLNGKVANNYGVASGAVRTASQIGNEFGEVDYNAGSAGSQTLRVVSASNSPGPAGRSYADSATLDYSGSNVTSGAWVQVDASTAAAFNLINIFSSCGEPIELGTGGGGAEARVLLIPPGGFDAPIPLAIAASTRLSVRALSTSCTSGQLILTGLN